MTSRLTAFLIVGVFVGGFIGGALTLVKSSLVLSLLRTVCP